MNSITSLCIFACAVASVASIKFPYKSYSGIKVSPTSLRMIYYHDETIAVVEVGKGKELVNCELIEIFNEEHGKFLLKNLTRINKPLRINLQQMMNLMEQCDLLDPVLDTNIINANLRISDATPDQGSENSESTTQSSIFFGIFPDTKWCGTGDLATNYFDLGPLVKLDVCCRAHDLCPTKVRAHSTKYNVTNDSMFTRSHCKCDQRFYNCLKKSKHQSGTVIGRIYFNLVRAPCIDGDVPGKMTFINPPSY
ncbi:uncharacterized protein LOC126838827 [Adelges cooleyi]|uniref:uncharacterized protein LOC126838827 n=1 Tax=Adelges cooleyi TaxID=133065 RepID=UPI00218011AE|nr:uncharacterized protein LOC126838827 [Adelges cooleyi]XP_050429525.1 uncharacterized protein LOC126838827 [Adelges cooleyi]